MTTQRTLRKWFQDPIKNADKIIENRLEWGADRCEYLVKQGNELDAVALYEEYSEWVNTPDHEDYGYLLLEQISAV
jgi:hypothetical protein